MTVDELMQEYGGSLEIVRYRGLYPAIYIREESGMHLIMYRDELRLVSSELIERDLPEEVSRMLRVQQLQVLHQLQEEAKGAV